MKDPRRFPKKPLFTLFWTLLAASLVVNLYLLYGKHLHYHFGFQYFPEFFAIFGFFGCMALILIAKGLGIFIVKEPDYYEKRLKKG